MRPVSQILFLCLFSCSLFANSERVIFHHIPKTGGLSVSEFLTRHFSKETTLPAPHQYLIKDMSPKELSQYNLIQGHFLVPRFKDLPGKRITFLRDPVQRVLSAHRYYIQRLNRNNELMCLQHLCPPGPPLIALKNQQCRFLSTLDINDPTITDRQHLESAKYNLKNNFFFVGITEDLNHALPILATLLGFDPPATVPMMNRTRKTNGQYSATLLEEIRNRNLEDIELYLFAKKLYETKFKHKNLLL